MEKANDLSQANILIPAALQKAKEAKTFIGRWKTITSLIQILPACLSDLSTHPCLPKLSLYHNHLQSICQTLNQVIHLAQQDNLGKLQMQNQLHSLSSLLAMYIKDCKLLTKSAILGDFSTWELLARLEIGHTEAKYQAIEALLEAVTADEKRVSSVFSRSHASALVHLLNSSPTPKLKEKTTMVICLLADSRNSAEILVSEGAIPPLIRVASSNGVFCRNKAVVSLQRLSLLPEAARSIVSHGGSSILMEICKEGEDVVSRVAAAGALKNLAAIAELRAELGREGIIRVMLHLLESSNPPECRDHAAECMQHLTTAELSAAAALAAALPKLLSFIDETAAPPAVAAVGNLVGTLPPAELISADLLPRLAGILLRGSPTAQQLAAAALEKASSRSATIKRLAGESGCVSLLVNLLSSKNEEDLKTYSASAMASLMQHLPNARTAKKDPRTVPTLIPLLSSAAAAEHAVSCLLALSTSHKSKKLMISHGAITKLSSMASSPNSRKLLYRLQRLKLKKTLQGG